MNSKSDIKHKNNVNITGKTDATQTMIFANGFGTDQSAWKQVVNAFKDSYRLLLFDNVGGGQAAPDEFSPIKYDNLRPYADDLRDICDAFDIKDAIMVGHSVSGMISLLAAIQNPHFFSKMILVGASPRYLNDTNYIGGFSQDDLNNLYQAMANNYYAWVSGFAPMAMANSDKPELAESFAKTLSAIRPDIAQIVAKVIFQSDYRTELPKLKHKTLLIQSQRDIAVPMDVAEYLNEYIKDSKLVVVNAEGHFPHISAPAEIISTIQNFI